MSVKEKRLLEEHGTKLMQLKPSSIWSAAMEDLRRREQNAEVTKNRQPGVWSKPYRPYAFHRKHVAKADNANDVLRAAIKEPGLGQASGKAQTRLLYSDVELLKDALK